MSLNYKGDVFLSPDLAEVAKLNPKINALIDAFKVFWLTGFHPSLGKDVPYDFPDKLVQSTIRHTHVRPIEPNSSWLFSFEHKEHHRRPTSDRCLTYCVTTKRNCLLISYIDKNAHTVAYASSTQDELVKVAESFFKFMNEFPLDKGIGVFDNKWLS